MFSHNNPVNKHHLSYGTHMTHCNFGEELGHCKYGRNAECPALHISSPQSKVIAELKHAWKIDVAIEFTEVGLFHWIEENVGDRWRRMLDEIYAELDHEDGVYADLERGRV